MATVSRPRILIADDHVLIAEACKNLLEPEFNVVGVVADGRALLRVAAELRPDVVIVDVAMPQLNGLDATLAMKQAKSSAKVIVLTMNTAADVAAEAFRRGASGYVVKHASAEELQIAVRRVLRGESYLSALITRETVDYLLRTGAAYKGEKALTLRQSEVLQLLAEGKSMKEVASILKMKPGTVAFHKYHIMETLGATSTAELIQFAIRRHMLAR